MTPEEQRQLVDKHYSLHAAGDSAAARELLTDDFSITIPSFTSMKFVATTVGGGCAVEIVELTLAGYDGPPVQVAELNLFRDNMICEIRPLYSDPAPWIEAAANRTRAGHPSDRA